ncbi:hypothetical protein AS850_15625 [Frondihabitans sp. 762G35]|uniref:hypothetical protein n=1 Tax=Frondihabitans sp. 762G35 TaxID=1446794 RepID=UPI000D2055E1|nr:hypothetical protein [Frondihabitans sp. 762G35]ARC58517.1 hypothetical protein AS850_15625 [Frondihabitans sp. 762G35]
MRIAAFVIVVLLSTSILLGGVVLLVLGQDALDPVSLIVQTLALTVLVYGPLTMGSFRAAWDVEGSQESRTYYRRVVRITLGLEVVAAIASVGVAVARSSGWVVSLAFVGIGIVLTAAALIVGPVAARWDRAHPAPSRGWVAIQPAEVRRKILIAFVVFGALVVLAVVAAAALTGLGLDAPSLLALLPYSLSLAVIGAGLVLVFSTLSWSRRLREVTDRDPSRLRRVAKVVLGRKSLDLDEQDKTAAARFASVTSITMPVQLAYLVLLYAGIMLQQVGALIRGDVFPMVLVGFSIAALAVFIPLYTSRIRRARRYAREHEAEVTAPADALP